MSKAKTHQGAAKRIRITARGKLRRGRQMAGHLKIAKSPRQLRSLAQEVAVDPRDRRRLARLLPYKRG